MTGQTPVGLWEPRLARRSLPNGMPLADPSRRGGATQLDASAIKGLFSSADEVVWPADASDAMPRSYEFYPVDAPTLIVTPSTVSLDLLAAFAENSPPIGVVNQGGMVRYITTPEPMTVIDPARELSAAVIRESLEHLRRELRLSARGVAALIGVSTRRYYEFRAGDEPPVTRLAEIRDRINIIKRLAARDLPAATELCRRDAAAVAHLLSTGRLVEVEELFRNTTRERAATFATEERPEIAEAEATELLAVVEGPAFQKILGLVRFLAPTVDNRTSERVAAALRMEKNARAVEHGDPVEDDWEFLLVLRAEAIADLRGRADVILRAEAFDPSAWAAFISSESERAWAAFDYHPASPLDAVPRKDAEPAVEAARGWQPDLARFGVDLSLYDRRTR